MTTDGPWTIELPYLPLSMNRRERVSHWIRLRELKEITNEITVLARHQRIPKVTGRRRVEITIHKSLRSRVTDDPSNRDSRSKACLDAMVHAGLLKDDSDKWLEWGHVREGEREKTPRTVIVLRDCE